MTIKEARKKAGLTQAKLAQKMGCTQKDISRWENGGRKPKYETLCKIASVCNINFFYLLTNSKINVEQIQKLSEFSLYTQTCSKIFEQIKIILADTCTTQQLSKIEEAINAAYFAGKNSIKSTNTTSQK